MIKKASALCLATMLVASPSFASVVLTGDYIQIGVDSNGTFGDGWTPPGFAYDSTGTGTFTTDETYDWFVPGTPWQGFTVVGNGSSYSNINGESVDISGGSVSDTSGTTDKELSLLWEGSISGLADVSSSVGFDTSDTYIRLDTTISATTDITGGQYGFFFDPDWFVTSCGSYDTLNSVISASQVTAEGCDGSVISLLTGSSYTHGVDTGDWSNDPSDYLDGIVGTVESGDDAIGIGFEFDLLAGEAVTLTFFAGFAPTLDDLVDIDDIVDVPEPSIFALLGLGFAGLGFSARRKKNS